MTSLNAQPTEKYLGGLLSIRIHAGITDIDTDSERENPYSELNWQSYKNSKRSKDDQFEGLTARFTIQSEVKQHLTFIFGKLISEIKNVLLDETDTAITIIEKLNDEHAESFGSYVFVAGEHYKDIIGKVLRDDVDDKEWIRNQLVGQLPQYAGRTKIYDTITTGMELFIKAVSWLTAKFIWYHDDRTINSKFFLGIFSTLDVPQIMLDEMQTALRAKKPASRKPKSKKIEDVDIKTAVTNAVAVVAADAADADAADDIPTADTPVTKQEIADTIDDAGLEDVMANF
jgi:hypothetical protein